MLVDDRIKSMTMKQENSQEIKNYAIKKGMKFMLDDAASKVENGKIPLNELLRVVAFQNH